MWDPPNGEIRLNRKTFDAVRPYGLNPRDFPYTSKKLPRIKEQRYSIHPSHKDPTGNLLKATTTTATGQGFIYHFTKAIKSGQRFAPLFIQRCPRLDSSTFDVTKPGIQEIGLGSYDPKHFTPFFGVFVAARDNEFKMPGREFIMPINLAQHEFRSIRIVLMWSFLALPSHNSGAAAHFQTSRATPERTEGYTPEQCCDYFIETCWTMEGELMKFIHQELGHVPNPNTIVMIPPVGRYSADGSTLTPEAAKYMESLKGNW